MRVDDVCVAAGGVRLPDLDELPAERPAGAIDDAAADDDSLAEGLARMLAREIVVERPDRPFAEGRPGQLRQGRRDDDERLLRSPEPRPDVVREVERWIRPTAAGVDDRGKRIGISGQRSPRG